MVSLKCQTRIRGTNIDATGDIAQYMLMSTTRYAFLVCADEIMFLKFEMIDKCYYPEYEGETPVDLFVEPWLHYTAPMKLTDCLDEENGKVPAKMALLYMLHRATEEGWQMEEDIGKSANYAAKTKFGEKWFPKLKPLRPAGRFRTRTNRGRDEPNEGKERDQAPEDGDKMDTET